MEWGTALWTNPANRRNKVEMDIFIDSDQYEPIA